jgi:hypothetical protein
MLAFGLVGHARRSFSYFCLKFTTSLRPFKLRDIDFFAFGHWIVMSRLPTNNIHICQPSGGRMFALDIWPSVFLSVNQQQAIFIMHMQAKDFFFAVNMLLGTLSLGVQAKLY